MAVAPFLPTPVQPVVHLLRQAGLQAPSDAELAEAQQLTVAEHTKRYPTRAALLHDTMQLDLKRQQQDHVRLYAHFTSPVERLFGLINYSLVELGETNQQYLADLSQHATTWELLQEHLATYSTPQLQQLLNEGIRQRLFRSDINIRLVTIILVQQLNIVLTPTIFPPTVSAAEIFRSVFLYYIRGLCTPEGAQQAAEHFARM